MKHAMMLELTESVTSSTPLHEVLGPPCCLRRSRSNVNDSNSGKLYYAPIGDSPQKIIDLGTGTGIWAVEGT